MKKGEFERLERGDVVKHKRDSRLFIVTGNYGDHVTAVATVDMNNPDEWEIVHKVDTTVVEREGRGATRWKLLHKEPNGHKLFVNIRTGKIAIADQSGYYPEQTHDGVLLIDTDEPIEVCKHGFRIPLKGGVSCVTSKATAKLLYERGLIKFKNPLED